MTATLKTCSCGSELSVDDWQSLPLVGYVSDDVETIELRNHSCGSTISLVLAGDES